MEIIKIVFVSLGIAIFFGCAVLYNYEQISLYLSEDNSTISKYKYITTNIINTAPSIYVNAIKSFIKTDNNTNNTNNQNSLVNSNYVPIEESKNVSLKESKNVSLKESKNVSPEDPNFIFSKDPQQILSNNTHHTKTNKHDTESGDSILTNYDSNGELLLHITNHTKTDKNVFRSRGDDLPWDSEIEDHDILKGIDTDDDLYKNIRDTKTITFY